MGGVLGACDDVDGGGVGGSSKHRQPFFCGYPCYRRLSKTHRMRFCHPRLYQRTQWSCRRFAAAVCPSGCCPPSFLKPEIHECV